MADEAVTQQWERELSDLWLSWVRNSPFAEQIQSGDCDKLSLITFQLLLPKPEIPEINHAVHYMLTKILNLRASDVCHSDMSHFATRLQDWRATRPQIIK